MMHRIAGCLTAIITPMSRDLVVDCEGLGRLVDFQVEQSVSGIVAVGTTGESPTLDWGEHNKVLALIHESINGRCLTVGGTGSNSTREALKATEYASEVGVKSILLVDPYYNGPSSIEIRREYVEPIAKKFPEIQFVPYVIPGRTGTQLLPQDLAILHSELPNVNAVKEATGNLDNMKRARYEKALGMTVLHVVDKLRNSETPIPTNTSCALSQKLCIETWLHDDNEPWKEIVIQTLKEILSREGKR